MCGIVHRSTNVNPILPKLIYEGCPDQGGRKVSRRYRFIVNSLVLTTVLAVPVILTASKPQENDRQEERRRNNERQRERNNRIYDRDHRDYHNWNDNEDQYYRRYLGERHRDYRPFTQQRRREQRDYWNWRHSQTDEHRDQEHR